MLNWMLKYRALGLSVIPLKKCSKEPYLVWAEFQKRIASEEEIKEWFKRWPEMNIGIVTGAISGVVVVDLDGPEGISQAMKLGLATSVVSITGNGKHLWFKINLDTPVVENSVRKYPGVDIRGEGGYVVAPPSIHESGRRYRWLRPFTSSKDLSIFPINLVTMESTAPSSDSKEKGWIAKALKDMKIGNIDETLVSVLGRLRRDGYTAEDARVILQPHAEAKGATPGHLEEKIRNIWNRYKSNRKELSMWLPNPTAGSDGLQDSSESISEFLKEEEPVEWLIPNLIAKNSIGFCVGLPESAKTWLMMDLAIATASGTNWISLFPAIKSAVLFIEQERFRGETKRRFDKLLPARSIDRHSITNLSIKCGSSIKIDLEHSYNAFVRLLEKLRPELVIIDSLATIHTKEENSRTEIQSVMEKFKTLRQQFGCAFWFISHPSKFEFQAAKEGEEPNIGSMAGSIALPAVAEGALFVRKAKGGGSTVYHMKNTLGPKVPPFGIVVEDVPSGIVVRGIQ